MSNWETCLPVLCIRRRPGPDEPDAQVIEDGPDHRRVFDAAADPHGALALRTDQGIDFVDLLYQPGPVSPKDLCVPLRFGDARNGLFATALLAFSSRDIAVPTIVSDHLFPPVRDMRAHGREPLRGVENLPVFAAHR